VKSKLRIFVVGVVAAMAATAAVPAGAATGPVFAYGGSAGGTKITAVGTTISSSATAQSTLFGFQPGASSNKIASVNVSGLANVGAINTDVTASALDDGFKISSHSRTANVSLLNGAITVQAVDTTSTASASHGTTTAGDTNTQLLGLVIGGKSYPVDVPKNTGVTIPGVATVLLNYSATSIEGRSVITYGGGLIVTLLAPQGSIAAGAEIVLNPTFADVQPATPDNPNAPSLGGMGYGAYAYAHVGDAVQAETGRIGNVAMPLAGTLGKTLNNHVANVNINSLLSASTVDTDVTGVTTASYARSTVTNKIAGLSLFNQLLFGGLISATAIGTTADVEMVGDQFKTTGSLQFVNLRIAGQQIPIDVAPNTKMHVANLGTVTINEQQQVAYAGFAHAFQVVGLHIVLDTAGYGLPVGAEVEIGVSQAIIWR
jgi:hypothetical protein